MLDLTEIPILETARLRLRRPEARDFDAYAALSADPEVMRYVGEGLPQSRRRAWQAFTGMLGHWAIRGYGQFAVESKTSGAFLGRVGLYEPDPGPARSSPGRSPTRIGAKASHPRPRPRFATGPSPRSACRASSA